MSKEIEKKLAFPLEVIAMWHPQKNGNLKLENYSTYSHEKAWWKCSSGHEWKAPIASIVISSEKQTKSKGCPFCQGLKSCPSNCLASTHNVLAKQWHPTKNGLLTPQDVTKGSNKKIWWKCPEGDDHEWRAAPNSRSRNSLGCPFCASHKTSKDSSLAAKFPHIAQEWDFEKNEPLKPTDVTPKSNKRVWWKCPKGHGYDTKVCHRTLPNARCPFCAGRRLSPERALITCNPKLATEFHPIKNGDLTAADVFVSSGKKIWWLCASNSSHEWQSSVDNRRKGNGCPYCSGKKVLPEDSFAYKFPDLLQEWNFDMNEQDPFMLAFKSNHKVHWKCKTKHYHCWIATVASRTEGNGCPYCSGHRLHENDSAHFQLPEKILKEFLQELNPTIDLKTTSLFFEKSIVWKCAINPKHRTWGARLNTRMNGKNNCPECEPPGTRIPYEKSVAFLHPHLEKELHPDNILSLRQLKAGSGRIVKWVCQFRKSHTYDMRVVHRVGGHGCPNCRNAPTLPELRLFSELSLFCPPLLHHKIGTDLVDIYLSELNVAVEWDSRYYHLKRFKSDMRKTQSLLSKGIRIIRLRDKRLNAIAIENDLLKVIYHSDEQVTYPLFKMLLTAIFDWGIVSKSRITEALNRTDFDNNLGFEDLKMNRGRHLINQTLSVTHPAVVPFWHSKKNGQLLPSEVAACSHERCWWQCKVCKAEWSERIVNVTKRNDVCSYCSKQKAGPEYNLLKLYPGIAAELIDADPDKITPHSGTRQKWECSKCNHNWKGTVNGRTGKAKNGCPRCAGKVLSYNTSIAGICDEAVKAWDFEKNSKKPEEVFPNTHEKYFFKCECGISYKRTPGNFIRRKQRKCPSCSKKKERYPKSVKDLTN